MDTIKPVINAWTIALLGLAGLLAGPCAFAQSRAGGWETRLGVNFTNSADWDFEGGTSADIDSDTSFLAGIAYHFSDNLEVGGNFSFGQTDYEASIAGDMPGEFFGVRGEYEFTTLMFDATWNFMSGPFSPFVTGGLGWSWVDTNIATEPPEVGCWWDPWWGYVCESFQDTRTLDGFTYQVGIGARYDFNDIIAVHGSYRMNWVDLDNATSTPDVDEFRLSIGWKF